MPHRIWFAELETHPQQYEAHCTCGWVSNRSYSCGAVFGEAHAHLQEVNNETMPALPGELRD
jgi:hypothetical protein